MNMTFFPASLTMMPSATIQSAHWQADMPFYDAHADQVSPCVARC